MKETYLQGYDSALASTMTINFSLYKIMCNLLQCMKSCLNESYYTITVPICSLCQSPNDAHSLLFVLPCPATLPVHSHTIENMPSPNTDFTYSHTILF